MSTRTDVTRRLFTAIALCSIWAVACSRASDSGKQVIASSDSFSPGFFNPPAGVHPVNALMPARFRGARPSYAWRIHNGKRELVAFSTPIQHIVIIEMENRTPEDLFGAYYNSPAPNGTPLGDLTELDLVAPTATALTPEPLNAKYNPNHEHEPGFTNKASNMNWMALKGLVYVPSPAPASTDPSVVNYLTLIEKFGYGNHVLQSNEGPSFEAHQYSIAAQSGGLPGSSLTPYGMVNNPGAMAGNDDEPIVDDVGDGTCFNTPSSAMDVEMTDMTTPYPGNQTAAPTATPCNEYTTILDEMASAAPSTAPYYQWQYVASGKKSIWAAPMSVKHLYQAYNSGVLFQFQPFAVDPDAFNFVLNVTGSTSPAPSPLRPFAALTYLTPCLFESDHPNSAGIDNGPQWLAWVVDSIESSSYWQNTVIIVTWDDWGGFWDNYTPSPWPFHHTPPPSPYNASNPNEWGFRVPLIVISPWVKQSNYVSSTKRSQGAILAFVEDTFGLSSLNGDDQSNDDLADMFNFSGVVPLPTASVLTRFSPQPVGACPGPTQL